MIQAILGLFGLLPRAFSTIDGITNAISNERIRQIDAKTEVEKVRSQERIDSLRTKRDVLIAESGNSKINAAVRASIGCWVSILIAKLLVWDKVVGSYYHCAGEVGRYMEGCQTFRTDLLDNNQWAIVSATIGFYFLYEGAVNVTRIIKS